MTIDEAISIMNVIVHMLEPQYDTDRIEDAVEMAIKALEKESFINKPCVSEKVCKHDKQMVLDKIRDEIEAKCCITVGRENDGAITLHDVFEIIDKYKEEGE